MMANRHVILVQRGPTDSHGTHFGENDTYLLTIMVESRCETGCNAFDRTTDGCEVLYRSQIVDDGAEISPLYHFSAGGRGRTDAYMTRWKVVPFGEIEVYSGDLPKHVLELMRCTGPSQPT